MKDIFAEVNKQMRESKERWTEIEKLAQELRHTKETAAVVSSETKIISLLLLLVEQLRPLQSTMGQAEDMQKEINNMLEDIAKMTKR